MIKWKIKIIRAVSCLQPLKDNAERLHMYFGSSDGWCPVSFYEEISKCVPDAESVLCDKGYQHAYVIGYSDEMAGIVVDWLKPDLGEAETQWCRTDVFHNVHTLVIEHKFTLRFFFKHFFFSLFIHIIFFYLRKFVI